MNNKGVLILTNNFPPAIGGAEKQAKLLSEYFAQSGMNVHVIFRVCRKEAKKMTDNDEGVVLHPVIAGSGMLSALKYFIFAFFISLKFKNQFSSIVAFQLSATALLAVFFGSFFEKHIVVRLAGSGDYGDIATSKATVAGRVKLFFVKKYTHIFVAISGEIADEMISEGFQEEKIERISNTVSTVSFYAPSRQEKQELKKRLSISSAVTVVYTGRLVKEKGLDALIDAWKEQSQKNALLVLVGDGNYRQHLEKKTKALGLSGKVRFAGQVDNVSDYLRAADIFVRFSDSEGISNSLLEAMATGLTCIASNIGGNNEVVNDGVNGFLVKPGDVKGLSRCLNIALSDEKLRQKIGLSARERVIQSFSQENLLHLWKDVLR